MRFLNTHDLFLVRSRLPKAVVKLLKERPVFLAGGFIRDTITGDKPHDIDLFAPSKDAAEAAALWVRNETFASDPSAGKVFRSDNAFTVRTPTHQIQLIHRWTFDDPAKCIESFDYTVAQAAMWWWTDPAVPPDLEVPIKYEWRGICSTTFYEDLAARRLVYTMPKREEEPGGSMLRLIKFYQRGYRAPLTAIGQVMARCCLGVRDLQGAIEEDQLGRVLRGLLRDVDPAIDPDHIMHESEADVPNTEVVG
jgi:hypothetical protein